jgi:hypothetical protein
VHMHMHWRKETANVSVCGGIALPSDPSSHTLIHLQKGSAMAREKFSSLERLV